MDSLPPEVHGSKSPDQAYSELKQKPSSWVETTAQRWGRDDGATSPSPEGLVERPLPAHFRPDGTSDM